MKWLLGALIGIFVLVFSLPVFGYDSERAVCSFDSFPINYYPFDFNATDYAGSNNGVVTGATHEPDSQFCVIGGCYGFDGGGEYITMSNDLNDNLTGFTVSGWLRGLSGGSHGAIVSLGYISTYGFYQYANAGTTTVASSLTDGSEVNPNYQDATGASANWEHWVFTYNNVTQVGVTYKDGTVMNNVTRTNAFNTSLMGFDTMYVGGYRLTVASTFWNHLSGYIDDVVIYDYSLDADEVRSLGDTCNPLGTNAKQIVTIDNPLNGSMVEAPFYVNFTISDSDNDNLQGNLSLYNGSTLHKVLANLTQVNDSYYFGENETYGSYNLVLEMCENETAELDCVGQSIVITYLNPVRDVCDFQYSPKHYWTLDANATDGIGSNDGNVSGATINTTAQLFGSGCYYFDGDYDYINLNNTLSFNSTGFSVSGWIKGNNSGSHGALVSLGYTSGYGYNLYANSATTQVTSRLYDGVEFSPNYIDNSGASLNWEHWVFSYDNNTDVGLTYKNGVLVDNETSGGTFDTSLMQDFMYIGAYRVASPPVGDFWRLLDGYIDDVSLYDYALNTSEVIDLYSGCIPQVVNATIPTPLTPFNITTDLYNYTMDYREFAVTFEANDTLLQAYAELYEDDCSTLVQNITANVFSDYVVDNSSLIGSSVVSSSWTDIGLDLDADGLSDKIRTCKEGDGFCLPAFEERAVIFNLSNSGQAYAFHYHSGNDVPEFTAFNAIAYYDFKNPIYALNGSFYGFIDFNGTFSALRTFPANTLTVYQAHLNSTSPKFNFSLFDNEQFGVTYCVRAFGYNGFNWNETSFVNFTTNEYVIPESMPTAVNLTQKECNVEGSLTGGVCTGYNELGNNTLDYCWDSDYPFRIVINNMWSDSTAYPEGSTTTVTCDSSGSVLYFWLFDYQTQEWSFISQTGLKSGNNHSVSFQVNDTGAYAVRCASRITLGDEPHVCSPYNDNDDLLFWLVPQDANYTGNVTYDSWGCNVDGSSVGGDCTGWLEETFTGSSNATIDTCGDTPVINLTTQGLWINNVLIDGIQVYVSDIVNVTVEFWTSKTSGYLQMYYYKSGSWVFVNQTYLTGLGVDTFENYSFSYQPLVEGIEHLRFSLTVNNVGSQADGCYCDSPYGGCSLADHDDIPFKTFVNPIPQVSDIVLTSATTNSLSLDVQHNVAGTGLLYVYDENCSVGIGTENLDNPVWTSPFWTTSVDVTGLSEATTYCVKAVLSWNPDYNSSFYNFTTDGFIIQQSANFSCFYNQEPYYAVNGFDVLCYSPEMASFSCYGKLEESGVVVQVTPERMVLKAGGEFNRFETDSNNAVIEFSRKNLKNDVPVMMSVYCSNGSIDLFYTDMITPQLATPYYVEDVLIYGKSFTYYIGLIIGLLFVLVLGLTFIHWLVKR